MERTHNCVELNAEHLDKEAALCGWVSSWRDHGGVIFIDLRDRSGLVQVVFNPEENKDLHQQARDLRSEFVLQVKGKVRLRPAGTENNRLPTGKVEVMASYLKILNTAETPPFEIEENSQAGEDIRLTYRYLDLRRPDMQRNLILRHKVIKLIRDILDKEDFIEIETPILTKSTPEGARDFIVPSRMNKGEFYALPQSPQLFKQILMVAGMEKYFQIAKCFRDEDLRADRQPEFTQLDVEMSFIDEDQIFAVSETVMKGIFKLGMDIDLETPFTRLTHKEALERFGTDKPDLRIKQELVDLTQELGDTEFKVFRNVIETKGVIKGLKVKGKADMSGSQIKELTEWTCSLGAGGLCWFKVTEDGLKSPIAKFFSSEQLKILQNKLEAQAGDLLLLIADKHETALEVSGQLRLRMCVPEERDKEEIEFLWVTDFPLFKYNQDEKRWDSEHHPFTSCYEEDMEKFDSDDMGSIRSRAYDLVINGMEIASGSIRIHKRQMQEKIFETIGLDAEEVKHRFGFLLEAFAFGAPPHGGIAFGLDRLMTIFTKTESIREVMAFPKTQKGTCLMTSAPSDVSNRQLKELGIRLG